MKKRGMKFLVLHALAHRLQNWADFLIRQIGEGPVLPDQGEGAKTRAETEIQESEMASEALSHSLSLSPEQEDLDMQLDGPPTHWLARVQKDAPDLLRQRRPARQSTTRLFGGPMVGP